MTNKYGPRITTDGLVLCLDAADKNSYPGTGTSWYDLSGNGNDGTLVNGVGYNSNNGGSLSFDGINDYIELNKTGIQLGIPNSGQMTVEAYVNVSSLANYIHIVDCADNKWHLAIESAAAGASAYFWNGTTYHLSSSPAIQDSIWYHLVGVQESNSIKIYINSVLATNGSITGTPPLQNSNIRIGMWQSSSGRNINGSISSIRLYNRALSQQEITQNYNALKSRYVLTKDGSAPSRAAASASDLMSLGITANGNYYIDLPTVGPTLTYCILDPAYDGGGWMMAMKATTGTTFNYSSNYWTTINTLNDTDVNTNNTNAKFNSMNYFEAKDIMAVWPDITNNGSDSGSIDNLNNWTWLENNFNGGTRQTLVSFFNSPSNLTYTSPTFGGAGYFIRDAKTFSGWASGKFSSQKDIRFYGFNYINNPSYGISAKVRWGFGWNENNEGLFPSTSQSYLGSNDVSGGIGMDTSFGSYSAGDTRNCCSDSIGINRSARVEIYIR